MKTYRPTPICRQFRYYRFFCFSMPAKKIFIFKEKTTPDKNEEDIRRLDEQIKEASKKRNYSLAQKLQSQYEYCLRVKEYYDSLEKVESIEKKLRELEDQRYNDEQQIKDEVTEKMNNIISDAESRLQQLEQKHQEEMEEIDKKFSDPRFSAVKMSTDIKKMLQSEDYYASKMRDFQMAGAYKSQITSKAQQEIISKEESADQTVNAAIEAAMRRYDTERKGFNNHLNNQKFFLKKDCDKKLQAIRNKYTKLRHNVIGSTAGMDPLPDVEKHERPIYQALDDGFKDILQRTESIYSVAPRDESSPSQNNNRSANQSPNHSGSPSQNQSRATNRSNRNGSPSRRRGGNTNEDFSRTVRNPRVSKALNKTINKNLAQTL